MSVFFYQPLTTHGRHYLEEEEANHCVRVLRHKAGDEIWVMDGKGKHFRVQIVDADQRKCTFDILETIEFNPDPYIIHLAIAPTKSSDRIEWMAEKCVELGVHKITLMQCDHSERGRFRTDRLHKKMIAAMKQSRRAFAPELTTEILSFRDLISEVADYSQVMMAYVDQDVADTHLKDIPLKGNCCVLIGPEGDFSTQEVALAREHNLQFVSLGPNRLRTETAGLAAVHIQLLKMQ